MNNNIIDPGFFSKNVSADNRRAEFNIKNSTILDNDIKVDIVFLGDSITNNLEINAFFDNSVKVIDRGISGDVTEYALKRFDADVVQLHPAHCVLLIGVNDSWNLEYDPWFDAQGKSIEEVLDNAYENIRQMAEKAEQNNINLIICSVLPTNMTFTNKNKERNIYIFKLNEKLKKLCEIKNLTYVDYYSEFVSEGDIYVREGLTLEGLHPNSKGYSIMINILKKKLDECEIKF